MQISQGVHLMGGASGVGAHPSVEQRECDEGDAGGEGEASVHALTVDGSGLSWAVKRKDV